MLLCCVIMHGETSLFDAIWAKKVPFLVAFFVIFTVTYGVLYAIDFLPEAPQETEVEEATGTETDEVEEADTDGDTPEAPVARVSPSNPIAIAIPSLDRSVKVLNPDDSSVAALDEALLSGVVRHPDSAQLGEEGNILILGHSSYLPTVLNSNYQAFNGVQKLNWGDTIVLESADGIVYTYRVEKVYEEKASEVQIKTDVTGKRLTLITCNSFGTKEDRFIVEATLIDTAPAPKTVAKTR